MRLTNVVGFFDCRQYKANTKRHERVLSANGERVILSVKFDEVPNELVQFAKMGNNESSYIGMKIFPKNCKAYNAKGAQIEFPTNNLLDGELFDVNLEVSTRIGSGTEPNGVYVNKIQFIRKANQAFEAVEDGDENCFAPKSANPQPTSPKSSGIALTPTFEPLIPQSDDVLPF